MEKCTETYYKAKDGTKLETEEECAAYETEEKRYRAALAKKNEAEKEIAVIEYARFKRKRRICPVNNGEFWRRA